MVKSKKQEELENQVAELTADLQRTRADFENYRKRAQDEKTSAHQYGQMAAIMKLLPVIDNIERSIGYMPAELADNKWAMGVASLVKNLEKSLESLQLRRIDASPGTIFDPKVHEAIQIDDAAEGDKEVVAEELQAGYTLGGEPLRPAMVRVTRTSAE